MQGIIKSIFLLLFSSASIFAQNFEVPKDIASNLTKVKATDIKAHIDYLADDKLLGRKPGLPGYDMAVDYVVDQFKKMKVGPGGDNNSYLQKVNLLNATTRKQDALFLLQHADGNIDTLQWGSDFIVNPHFELPEVDMEAELVFAGYGIHAPEIGYNDYENIDVKGKVVVILRGVPAKFPSTIAAHSQGNFAQLEAAFNHGAVGVLIGTLSARPLSISDQVSIIGAADEAGKIVYTRAHYDSSIKLFGNLGSSVFNQLFKDSNLELGQILFDLENAKPASAALNQKVKVSYKTSYRITESHNVIGLIPGSDPKLKNEYVVHSAHLDHIGVGRPVKGDSINNGAHDNASGVASLLEIAKIYSSLKEKPKRSILIVMVTAEEMGLLGSAYFVRRPTVPKESIVAGINTDMPTLIAPLLSAVALGAEHSSLNREVAAACKYLGIDLEEDPEPEQVRFVRSDQYSFVMGGIPALHIKYGNKSMAGVDLKEMVRAWRAEYYHRPQDNPDGIFDYEAGKTYVQLNFLISYFVAQNPQRPYWLEGDFFGGRFGATKSSSLHGSN
jgi:hypothetical protein